MKKQKLVVIIGPTAVGKTKLSIKLAKKFNGEIISGDSAQVFKGMDIGTAKITEDEKEGIPHYLIDCRQPSESYNVYDFKHEVKKVIDDITLRGKLPILVGGTGLYIQSVLYDYKFPETTANPEIRKELEERIDKEGNEAVYQTLVEIDPIAAKKIHPNNTKRVIRALEVYYDSGKRFSEQEHSTERTLLYDVALIGLTMDRDLLYKRINERVEMMMDQGLEEEVRDLYDKGLKDAQSMQAIGYKEFSGLIEGIKSRDEVIEEIQRNSRRFAKRQFTWFRNKMDVHWYDMTDIDNFDKISEEISTEVAGMLDLKANS